jgi:hypothetical protein
MMVQCLVRKEVEICDPTIPGLAFENSKLLLKSGIFKEISWMKGLFFEDDWRYLKDECGGV